MEKTYFVTLTADDEVIKTEYSGLRSLQSAVGGYIEFFSQKMLKELKLLLRNLILTYQEHIINQKIWNKVGN